MRGKRQEVSKTNDMQIPTYTGTLDETLIPGIVIKRTGDVFDSSNNDQDGELTLAKINNELQRIDQGIFVEEPTQTSDAPLSFFLAEQNQQKNKNI